ncbi:MAG: DUF4474 domain-containing protein [Clostridia bacterium]|nr:DUF4474 domain-containing protein [Clostridia bacterium]
MTKTARNGIIAAAVVAVVAVAAAPLALKGLQKKPANTADVSVSATDPALNFSYPDSAEDTTADILSEILDNMDNQQATQAGVTNGQVNPQPTTSPQYTQAYAPTYTQNSQVPSTTAPAQQQTTQAATQSTTRAGLFNRTTTSAPATTTKKAAATTKKAETTTQKVDTSKGNMTAISGQEAMSAGGVVSYLWDPNEDFFYVDDNPWQRNFGFNVFYDWAAATMVMYYDTWRACFDYDGLEWMIQGWKGQYGFMFIGGEIGVYTRVPGESVVTSTHYNCADDNHLVNMEMSIYYDAHDGNGYQKLFTRAYYPHWWVTGFVDGHLADYKFNDRSCLIMEARLTMYDQEMLDAFTTALAGCGFRRVDSRSQVSISNPDTFTTSGNDVYFSWKTIDQGYKTR